MRLIIIWVVVMVVVMFVVLFATPRISLPASGLSSSRSVWLAENFTVPLKKSCAQQPA